MRPGVGCGRSASSSPFLCGQRPTRVPWQDPLAPVAHNFTISVTATELTYLVFRINKALSSSSSSTSIRSPFLSSPFICVVGLACKCISLPSDCRT